jgi:hypothetical protein
MKENEAMGEYFNALKEHFKEQRQKRNDKWEPILIEKGCIKKSDGVYEKGDWLIYPTKGFVMHKKKNKKRMSINQWMMK